LNFIGNLIGLGSGARISGSPTAKPFGSGRIIGGQIPAGDFKSKSLDFFGFEFLPLMSKEKW